MMDTSRKDAGRNGAKLEDTRRDGGKSKDIRTSQVKSIHMDINGAGGMDAKIEKSLKGNHAKIKSDLNKQGYLKPEEDPRFHDTYKFLRRYRDATYSLKVVVHQMEKQFRMRYGTSVDEFLDSIYTAGAELSGDDIEERAKSIERSNRMLKMLDSSVDLLRTNHKHGEQYFWILYYTFLSPQELHGTNEIIETLKPHISNISYRTYYRKRHAAIEALSTILWGFTAKETIALLDEFFPEI